MQSTPGPSPLLGLDDWMKLQLKDAINLPIMRNTAASWNKINTQACA